MCCPEYGVLGLHVDLDCSVDEDPLSFASATLFSPPLSSSVQKIARILDKTGSSNVLGYAPFTGWESGGRMV